MPRRPDGRFEGCSGETRLPFEGATFGVMVCSHSGIRLCQKGGAAGVQLPACRHSKCSGRKVTIEALAPARFCRIAILVVRIGRARCNSKDGAVHFRVFLNIMYLSHSLRHGPGRPMVRALAVVRTARARGITTEADIESARKYCVNQLRSATHENSTLAQGNLLTCLAPVGKATTIPTSSANSSLDPPKMPTMRYGLSTSSSHDSPRQSRTRR